MNSERAKLTTIEENKIEKLLEGMQFKNTGAVNENVYKPIPNDAHVKLIKKLKPIDLNALKCSYMKFRHSISSDTVQQTNAYKELINNNKLHTTNKADIVKSFAQNTLNTIQGCFKMLATQSNEGAKNKFYKFMITNYGNYGDISKEKLEREIIVEKEAEKKQGRIKVKDIRFSNTTYEKLMHPRSLKVTRKQSIITPNEKQQRRKNYGRWYLCPLEFNKILC
jgi:hypothetical protein